MDIINNRHSQIRGWGADLERTRRPAEPMERTPPRLVAGPRHPPVQQVPTAEVLHSTERPGITPVFGSSVPPSGVSGRLRRFAFRYSENDLRHWMILLLADRVQVGEGLASDLSKGRVPHVFAEMGGRAELKHNPAGVARKALVLVGGLSLAYLWWRKKEGRTSRRWA